MTWRFDTFTDGRGIDVSERSLKEWAEEQPGEWPKLKDAKTFLDIFKLNYIYINDRVDHARYWLSDRCSTHRRSRGYETKT